MQRIVGQGLEAPLHLFFGKVEPELEDQRAFVAQHFFKTLGLVDRLIHHGVFEQAMNPALQHLAVPVTEENPHATRGRQHPPITPGRWSCQFLIRLLVEGTDLDQTRVHPFVEQLDRLALAGAFDAIDQDDHRETFLLLKFELRFKQGFAQRRHLGVIGFFVDGVTDFSGFKHWTAPSRIIQD